jgi:rare lipoprotein A (peptidoglycan hydrolase)
MERCPKRTTLPYLVITILALVLPLSVASAQSVRHQYAKPAPLTKQVTRASWYGKEFEGRRTADGSVFHMHDLTAAHRTLDMGTRVRVTELRSGRSVVVQITDRGPFLPDRGIDLSFAAARQLGIVRRGVARVRLDPVDDAAPLIATACSGAVAYWLPKAIVE